MRISDWSSDVCSSDLDTNLLVADITQGESLARTLGPNNVVLMRGHGFTAASRSLIEVLRIAIYLPRNARVQTAALALGGDNRWLRDGEIAAREAKSYGAGPVATQEAWRLEERRVGKEGGRRGRHRGWAR